MSDSTLSIDLVTWTPPLNPLVKCPFPRPPAWICALTTNSAFGLVCRIDSAIWRACAGVVAICRHMCKHTAPSIRIDRYSNVLFRSGPSRHSFPSDLWTGTRASSDGGSPPPMPPRGAYASGNNTEWESFFQRQRCTLDHLTNHTVLSKRLRTAF